MITAERVRELFHYDPEVGVFTHLATCRRAIAGAAAGEITHNGYVRLSIDGKRYRAHHIAWLLAHGELPPPPVDHINGDPADNRLVNLRLATPAQNKQNMRRATAASTTGYLGVSRQRRRFRAAIRVDGKTRVLGTYDTPEEAHQRYLKAKREHHAFATI